MNPAALDSLTEILTAFQTADNTINGAISSLSASATTNLEAAVTELNAADVTLQANIDAEATTARAAELELSGRIEVLDSGSSEAVQAEVARATAVEAALESSKANLAGDNSFTGNQTFGGFINLGSKWRISVGGESGDTLIFSYSFAGTFLDTVVKFELDGSEDPVEEAAMVYDDPDPVPEENANE